MKKLFLTILAMVNLNAFANSKTITCIISLDQVSDTASMYTTTVRECLNRANPGLAGRIEETLIRMTTTCEKACDFDYESRQSCSTGLEIVDNWKSSFPYHCTN